MKKLKVPRLAGNRNAAKYDEPTKTLSVRIPASLHAWVTGQPSAGVAVTAALSALRLSASLPSPAAFAAGQARRT